MNELITESGTEDDVKIITDVNDHADIAIDLGCGDDNPYN